jgi:hypothetical protein
LLGQPDEEPASVVLGLVEVAVAQQQLVLKKYTYWFLLVS